MRHAWALRAVTAWLAAAGPAGARPADGAQRLGDASPGYLFALDPAVATAPGGRSVALVADGRRMVVRRAAPGRAFGPAHRIATPGGRPAVAAGDGLTALAWTHFDHSYIADPVSRDEDCCARLRAATLDAAGRVSRQRELSSPGYSVGDVRVVARGRRAAVAWLDGRGVRASATTGRRRFGPPKTLSRRRSQVLGVALTGSGPHVFLLAGSRVMEAWRSGGRARQRTLGRFTGFGYTLRTAVTPTGHLLMAATVGADRSRADRVLVAYRRPGGALQQHVVRLRRRVSYPMIAVALCADGRGLLATASEPTVIAVRVVGADGRLGRPRTTPALATRRGYTTDAALGVNRTGAGVLGALVATARGDLERTRAVAWSLAPGGRPQRRRILSGSWRSLGPQDGVTATIDASGHRRVAWAHDDALLAVRLP